MPFIILSPVHKTWSVGKRDTLILFSFARFAALLQQFGDQASPARLVARADALASVSMEVFVEEDEVAPVGIVLEFG
jgi:hypothetical protein